MKVQDLVHKTVTPPPFCILLIFNILQNEKNFNYESFYLQYESLSL